MNLLPLDQIRLDLRSHASALRWIGLLYCRPKSIEWVSESLPRLQGVSSALRLQLHALPYLILLGALGRWFLFGGLGLKIDRGSTLFGWTEGLRFHGSQLAGGFALGFALTAILVLLATFLDLSRSALLALGMSATLACVLTFGSSFGVADGLAMSLPIGVAMGCLYVVSLDGGAWSLFAGLTAILVISVAVTFFTRELAGGLALAIGLAAGYLRLYCLLVHSCFLWLRLPSDLYRFHPAAWDGLCLLPFPGFERLLVAYAERDSEAGEREIERLIDEYPSQRGAALRARAILIARRAAATASLAQLDDILAKLPEGKRGFLAETGEIRRRVHEISVSQARLDTLDRPFLREPFAALVVKEIEAFTGQIAGFRLPLASEFRQAARQWLTIARRELDAARAAAGREPTRQVFSAGKPIDREREAFVLRASILGELERQVTLASGSPGLLLYGRRRMGKSTLLRNLEGFLPPRLVTVKISMQEAGAFTSLPDLIDLIGRRVGEVLPGTPAPATDLKGLASFLSSTQKSLDAAGRRLLLAIDEYEYLDEKIGAGVLPLDLLAVLRESIQTHRKIIWIFAGSHAIDELDHAPWPSYLVSARTLEVTSFEPAETRLLLTEPLRHSSLWRSAEVERPRFAPGFWGEGGIERIHATAGGWPHLVQLLAETVVDLVNDAGGAAVDDRLFGRATDRAVVRGNNVFLELLEKESHLPGEWDYLRAFRRAETRSLPPDEAVARSLRRRQLVNEEDGRFRLRVPLMARWLKQV